MTTSATPPTIPTTIRRATSQDAEALIPLASKFVEQSAFANLVPLDDECARAAMLRCLVSGVGGALVFVAEQTSTSTAPGREHESVTRIVGAVMGEMRTVWHSRKPVVEMLGGFAESTELCNLLWDSFRSWARKTQHASCVVMQGEPEALR